MTTTLGVPQALAIQRTLEPLYTAIILYIQRETYGQGHRQTRECKPETVEDRNTVTIHD